MKLENLLLDASGKVLKITDFGFAKNVSVHNPLRSARVE